MTTEAMRRAIALSGRVLDDTSPNPVAGCVVFDAAGEDSHSHAEIVALRQTGDGTLHHGRTGPCAEALTPMRRNRSHLTGKFTATFDGRPAAHPHRLCIDDVTTIGPDLRITGRYRREN